MALSGRFSKWYHSLFHLAAATLHDRWVKRLRLLAFISATSVMTQVWSRNVLGYLGLAGLVPTSALGLIVATTLWLVSYPAMWARMVAVMTELEARNEFHELLLGLEHLHHHHRAAPPPVAREGPGRLPPPLP